MMKQKLMALGLLTLLASGFMTSGLTAHAASTNCQCAPCACGPKCPC